MSDNQICSICSSNQLKKAFTLPSYPAYIVPVPLDISKKVEKAELTLFFCENCSHMQTLNPDKELQRLIYEEYYSYYVVDSSESFVPHYRIPFINFIENLRNNNVFKDKENILEIGCSSGNQVSFFKQIANNYYGIDPSEKIDLGKEKHPDENFVKGYFPEDICDVNFDVIVSQFNLEHILNVTDFIFKIHSSLNEDGIVIIQVPDVEDFLRNKQPNFMAHEHIQYFTKSSLQKLLESQNFEIIEWGNNGPSLIVAARKSSNQKIYSFDNDIELSFKNIQTHIDLFHSRPKNIPSNVVYYGVGPLLYWLASQNNGIDDCIVCDDNPNYNGQGLPGYGNEIFKPSEDIFIKNNTIVLSLNKFYHSVVIQKLKKYRIPMEIYLINDEGEWQITHI